MRVPAAICEQHPNSGIDFDDDVVEGVTLRKSNLGIVFGPVDQHRHLQDAVREDPGDRPLTTA